MYFNFWVGLEAVGLYIIILAIYDTIKKIIKKIKKEVTKK